ncbi:FAD-binding protein [Paracoccus pacificus]|uniref:FAD-binding protein n=1 Tax=Paracoccus pacificus TaxID=1463598 RepID=A0ABW4R5V7_9RHOB
MRPESEERLAEIVRTASGPLHVRGGGTHRTPPEDTTVIEMAGLTGVTLYEPAAMTLVAAAGTTLDSIDAILAAEGQQLAFEPPSPARATLGGMVAMNASGPRRVQAGACRDSLIGLRFVDGLGQVAKNGGRVMKNVTGYDLVKLMAGSRGTLGVLTEVAFKTAPIPPAARTLSLPDLDAAHAVAALTAALTSPHDVSGAAWLPGRGAMVRVEGLAGSVGFRAGELSRVLAQFGPVEVDAADAADWRELADIPVAVTASVTAGVGITDPVSDLVSDLAGDQLWRILCRPSQSGQLLRVLPTPVALDWGGALIWVRLPRGWTPPPGLPGQGECMDDGRIFPAPDPRVARLNAELRAKFDPRGIFGD